MIFILKCYKLKETFHIISFYEQMKFGKSKMVLKLPALNPTGGN